MLANSRGEVSLFKLRFCYSLILLMKKREGSTQGSHTEHSQYAFDSPSNHICPPRSPPLRDISKPDQRDPYPSFSPTLTLRQMRVCCQYLKRRRLVHTSDNKNKREITVTKEESCEQRAEPSKRSGKSFG